MQDDGFLEFVLDQLSGLTGVTGSRMFGGAGLYQDGVFFGIVSGGRLYLLTGEGTRRDYIDRGMQAFEPNPGQVLKNYYEVPVDVLEDDAELTEWARRAVRVQQERTGSAPRKKKRSQE